MKYEVEHISVWSFIKVSVIVNLTAGLLLGFFGSFLVGPFLMILAEMPRIQTGGYDFAQVPLEFLMLFMPVGTAAVMTFVNTLVGLVAVFVYNVMAKLTGGIIVNLKKDKEETVTTSQTTQVQHTAIESSTSKPQVKPVEKSRVAKNELPPPPPPVLSVERKDVKPVEPTLPEENSITQKDTISMSSPSQALSPVRVRIAPSPSGYLHVGTARMAIANYLYARHTGGQFVIRIENTDADRSDDSLIEPIISALRWLGIESDEPIVYQSDRIEMYKTYAQKILSEGHGYRCFCTPEQLATDREEAVANKAPQRYNRRCLNLSEIEVQQKIDANEPFAIRLKIPEGETSFADFVSGDLKRDNGEIEDLIVARSDGTATYNLAVVVDDHEMGITDVVRGNDHITNTFKQVLVYRALGWDVPRFGHVPLILRPDKKKVSKRLGDKDVAQYREEGILPEAMFNFLALLGWSSKTDQEIFTVDQLINIFTPHNFNNSNAVFDEEKLEAFNKEHIQFKSDHELAMLVAPMLVESGYTTKYWLETRWEYLRQIITLLKPRVRRISDFVPMSKYFFEFDGTYDESAVAKAFTVESAIVLTELADRFEQLKKFDHDTIGEALAAYATEKELKKGKLILPTRLAVSGVKEGPGLFDMLAVLSQPVVVERMRKAVEYIKNNIQ